MMMPSLLLGRLARRLSPAWLALTVPLAPLAPVAAQTPTVVLQHGDPLGSAFLTQPEVAQVGDDGRWLVESRWTDMSLNSGSVLILDGDAIVQSGMSVQPSFLGRVQGIRSAETLGSASVLSRLDAGSPTGSELGLYVDTRALVVKGDPLALAPYSPAARVDFISSATSNGSDLVLAVMNIKDGTSNERALVRLDLDENSFLVGQEAVAYRGEAFGTNGTIVSISNPTLAPSGAHVAYSLLVDFGPGPAESRILLDDVVVAGSGLPAPLPGETWVRFDELDLNANGELVMLADLGLSDTVVATPDRIVARVGDPVPGAQGETFRTLDDPFVTANGEVGYRGSAANLGSGIYLEDERVVDANTVISGLRGAGASAPVSLGTVVASPSGRYLLFEVTQIGGADAAALLDLGRVADVAACTPQPAKLFRDEGFAVAGTTVRLGLEGAPVAGALPILLVSDALLPGACGLPLGIGELTIDVGATNPFLILSGPAASAGSSHVDVAIQNNPLLIDAIVYAQGAFLAPGSGTPLALTNAVEIEIGAP